MVFVQFSGVTYHDPGRAYGSYVLYTGADGVTRLIDPNAWCATSGRIRRTSQDHRPSSQRGTRRRHRCAAESAGRLAWRHLRQSHRWSAVVDGRETLGVGDRGAWWRGPPEPRLGTARKRQSP